MIVAQHHPARPNWRLWLGFAAGFVLPRLGPHGVKPTSPPNHAAIKLANLDRGCHHTFESAVVSGVEHGSVMPGPQWLQIALSILAGPCFSLPDSVSLAPPQ